MSSIEKSRLASHVLTGCCLVLVALAVRKELSADRRGQAARAAPRLLPDWESVRATGTPLGSPDGVVQVLEFGDFECPACASFVTTLRDVKTEMGTGLAIRFVHFPLPQHRFAKPAAIAAECAAYQGSFQRYHDTLFDTQDSLGMIPWTELAQRANVPDSVEFAKCIAAAGDSAVSAGVALGRRLGVSGTPAIVINGWLLPHPPTVDELKSYILAFSRNETPRDFRRGR